MFKIAVTLGITSTVLLALCIFMIWYSRKLLASLLYLSENIGDLLAIMGNFSLHLQSINEMEMYYGDPTLENLLNHCSDIVTEIEVFQEIIQLSEVDSNETQTEPEEELNEEPSEQNERTDTAEKKAQN
jgi:hypothetical protein